MIRFLLDTNICIYIIKKHPAEVIQKLQSMDVSEVGISPITLSELEYGVNKSAKPRENALALAEFMAPFEVPDYDDFAAREYGKIRALLESRGTPIGPLDTLIAAHALSLDCTLVTNNEKEFLQVPDLEVVNWVTG